MTEWRIFVIAMATIANALISWQIYRVLEEILKELRKRSAV